MQIYALIFFLAVFLCRQIQMSFSVCLLYIFSDVE